MKVTIKSISLLNFKGIRSFSTDFNADVTEFRGDNGTGKTSLNDAFDWLLYDKDSSGRNNFQIKTLDEQNNVIERIPHEVSAVLDVDGTEIRLRKCFVEVWKKKRGKSEEEFSGHTVERYWNDVPITEKEYNEKIAAICNEEVFRLITNPAYFFSLKKEYQRNFLIQLAGNITNETLAVLHPEFQQLVSDMSGKTTDEYNREIGAQIKRIKADSEGIPQRIDERKRDVPQSEDWNALEAEISSKQSDIDAIEKQISSELEAYNNAVAKQREKIQKKSSLEVEYSKKKQDLVGARTKQYYEQYSEKDRLKVRIQNAEYSIRTERESIEANDRMLATYAQQREDLLAEWRTIKARTITFDNPDDERFICPTCKRPLEAEDIARKQQELTAAFNAETSRLLEDNSRRGKAVKASRERLEQDTKTREQRIAQYEAEIEQAKQNPLFNAVLTMPDTANVVDDPDLVKIQKQIDELTADIETNIILAADQTEKKQRRAQLQQEVTDLRDRLKNRERIEANDKRIKELEAQFKTQNDEIARLEGVQFKIAKFKKCLIDEVESKINSLFSYVRFKMYEQQINGGERETCEALVNGVPYSTNVNTAARVNAGIDVINAICKANGIYAPLFIDNKESITKVIPTESQLVLLTKDENYTFITKI